MPLHFDPEVTKVLKEQQKKLERSQQEGKEEVEEIPVSTNFKVTFTFDRKKARTASPPPPCGKKPSPSQEVWLQEQHQSTLLRAMDSAWCGKALLAEAMRYQYTNKSKRLTKTFLEKMPLMAHHQRRYEEDLAFELEEKLHDKMVADASKEIRAGHVGDEDELVDKLDNLERMLNFPEVDPSSVIAPLAPELATAVWNDIDVVLGNKCIGMKGEVSELNGSAGYGDGKYTKAQRRTESRSRYEKAIHHFSTMNLWRLSSSSSKKKSGKKTLVRRA